MGKKFVGLDGLKHFWSKAKTWILEQITAEVTAKIAELVANAPEDLDTLKEIADWISAHADSASAMNTQIQANAEAIAGKADKAHTHSASDISGTLPIANGGTGASNGQDAFDNIVSDVRTSSNPSDNETMLIRSSTWYKTTVSSFWEYIKGKISSVLGITNNKHIIKGQTVATNTYTDTNPKLVFSNEGGIQNASLTFTSYDSVQAPASVTLNGNQGGEYFIAPNIKATGKFYGNLSGNATKSSFLDEYIGAGGNRLTSGNIKPKDATEYGGMRKDVVTLSMTDSGRPSKDGHLLTMFWDNDGRYDSQFFVSTSNPPVLKVRTKQNATDYYSWIDVATSKQARIPTSQPSSLADGDIWIS